MPIRHFTIHLAPDAGRPMPRPREPSPLLVVDDLPADLESTLVRLVRAGYSATVASDGDGALRRVRGQPTRLLVAELFVPCTEGPCVVTVLKRERARLPRLRILVLTRHVGAADEAWAIASGAEGVLHKSSGDEALVRELQRLDEMDDAERAVAAPGGAR